jgi:putative hydrolase of the HAD superfamily
MNYTAVLFDVNSTLVDIKTDEHMEEIYRGISHYLGYQGIEIHRGELKDIYFQVMDNQRKEGGEEYPEFDAVALFHTIIEQLGTDYTRSLPEEKLKQMPLFLAELYRGIALQHLRLYPGVKEVLDELTNFYRLAIVTDAQRAYAIPELSRVGIVHYFDPIVVSSDFGYRKPDVRLFTKALETMEIGPERAIYVGNDLFHDVYGAQQAGMKTVWFASGVVKEREITGTPDYTIREFPALLEAIGQIENL